MSLTQRGFTLIETAIVLVIMGLILGGLMTPLSVQMENSRRSETLALLSSTTDALMGYTLMTGHLPCPDTNGDGIEDRLGNACVLAQGTVPWSTLAVGRADGWGNTLTYRVTLAYADTVDGTGCGVATQGISFSLCSAGDIQVLDGAGGAVIADNLPAILISEGKNNGTPSPLHEAENVDVNATFVSRDYAENFDDIIQWVVPGILVSRAVNAGLLP